MVLAEFLAFLGAVTETILATSAVASALMALVLLWLYYRVLPEQRWVKYLGLAYSIFLFQYLLSWLAQHITPESLHSATAHAIQATSSALYNILLFMAAGALLAISKRQLTTIATASIAAIPIALILPDIWQRFPDKIVTFLCILALGRAFFVNLNSIGNPKLAHLAAATCLAYAALNLAYAYNPILTEANLYLNNQLSERLSQLGEILTGRQSTISNAYDAAVFTAAFPLRLAIFAAALALITRSLFMLSATAYRSMLRQVVDGEAEYLHSNGVVRAVGESFRANLSEICMRAPGSQKKIAVWWRWTDQPSSNCKSFQVTQLPSAEESAVGRVLAEGERVFSADWTSDGGAKDRYSANDLGMRTLVTVPIFYHRATVGALNLEWSKKLTVNEATLVLRQAQTVADYLAPVVQSQRQLSALDGFSARLSWPELSNWNYEENVLRQVAVVHDTMSVFATGIGLKVGFRAVWAACSNKRKIRDRVLSDSSANIDALVRTEVARLAIEFGLRQNNLQVRKTRLVIIAPGAEPLHVGTLRMADAAFGAENFDTSRAPLGSNYMFRRTVAALVASNLVESVRMELSAALSELQTRLQSKELYSVADWITEIESGITGIGLPWAVAAIQGRTRLLGRPGPVRTVEELLKQHNKNGNLQEDFAVYDINHSGATAYHAISLHLPVAAGAQLWIGVSRMGFGHELKWNSPWRAFLERVREAANTALLRIISTMEFEKLALDQARTQGLITTLVTMGTITHQLSNFASGMSGSVEILDEATRLGKMHADDDTKRTIRAMKESTTRLQQLLEPLSTMTVVDERRPCDLQEAIREAEKLHSFSLREKDIVLKRPPNEQSMLIDIPFYVATLALANLITNSLDAIGRTGTIEITTEDTRDVLVCHVKDDGPGLPISNPFDLGVTTKERSGGWGLYLTRRSLRENQSEIQVTDPGPGGTVFTLRFPKAQP